MVDFVLDCSVTIPWIMQDDAPAYSLSVLKGLEENRPRVPFIWSYEVANALCVAVRLNRIPATKVRPFLETLDSCVDVESTPRETIWKGVYETAHRYNLSAYDAAYLYMAQYSALAIATLDKKLRKAASEAGIPLFQPA